jgi:bifunctional oligoribonuclease and PAP phosphatase NrnA
MESYFHRQIHDLLIKAQNPVFISDERIDGDSLGAALALADYMLRHGRKIPVYVAQTVPEQYRMLPRIEHATTDDGVFDDESIDLVVVFDCSDELFVKDLVDRIPADPTVVNIDHHATNSRYGDVNQVITDAPATAEIIYRFFEENKIIPSRDAATCMLTGLCFDTGAFSNAATDHKVLQSASSLIMYGARVQEVIRTMFRNRSISALRVWGSALERLYQHPELGYVSTCLTRKDIEENQVTDDEIDGLSNFLSLVTDAPTLFVLRETLRGDVKVSMRSQTRDVGAIAKAFGGGGHPRAAGFSFKEAKLRCNEDGCWKVVSSAHS